MGDLSNLPVGRYAQDVFRDTGGEDVKTYGELHQSFITQLGNMTGINRSVAINFFNESYAFNQDVRIPTGSGMMHHVTKDYQKLQPEFSYLRKVLHLCLSSDICQKLGMSLEDFMGLDLATFSFIEKAYADHKPAEQDAVDELMRSADLAKKIKGR